MANRKPPQKATTSAADAFSGDPSRAAVASGIAGCIQAVLLLPANTLQTQMQYRGDSLLVCLRSNFSHGALSGLQSLYRALVPTVSMLCLRQGLKFGVGSSFKQQMPPEWPEIARDMCAGAGSACAATTLFFPLDTLKTRWQTGRSAPSLGQMYFGFRPAVTYSAFGMAFWICARNFLERHIPDPDPSRAGLRYWKHLLTGGLAGIVVQLPTFPFDTLKKRLQAAERPTTMASEARVLLRDGGPMRFYRGFALKCGFVALNGALFNCVYVAVRRLLRMHS